MRIFSRIFILVLCLCHLGTIYVIKEGGQEVGRWEEADGSDAVVEVESGVQKITPSGSVQNTPQKTTPRKRNFDWTYDLKGYQAAVEYQKKTQKPILLYFHASWCPHCRTFEKKILFTRAASKGLGQSVKVQIDVEKERALAQFYQVTAFPRFFVIHPDGGIVRISTQGSPAQFLESCRRAGVQVVS